MAIFIQKRERVDVVNFSHSFRWIDDPEAGFSFDCTEDGEFITEDWDTGVKSYGFENKPLPAQENCLFCFSEEGAKEVEYLGIKRRVHHYMQPSIIKCERCESEVTLDDMSDNDLNTCDGCGQGYNFFGQMVNGGLREIDPMYAGEHWDND